MTDPAKPGGSPAVPPVVIVAGAPGAGASTWARACAVAAADAATRDGARHGPTLAVFAGQPDPGWPKTRLRGVAVRRLADPEVAASGGLGDAVASAIGLAERAVDDLADLDWVRRLRAMVELHDLHLATATPVFADLGAWHDVAGAIADTERWSRHLMQVHPVDSDDARAFSFAAATRGRLAGAHRFLTVDAQLALVTSPDGRGVAFVRHAVSVAALLAVAVAEVVVNRVLPQPDAPDRWDEARSRQQTAAVAEITALATAAGARLVVSPERAAAPTSTPDLRRLRSGPVLPLARRQPSAMRGPAGCRVTQQGNDAYLLHVPVGPATTGVQCARRGDSLLVGVAGVTRQIRLTGALSRCVVESATVREGELQVRLEPDPALWPQTRVQRNSGR